MNIKIIYPTTRFVTAEWVIQQARDILTDEAVYEAQLAGQEEYAAYVPPPTLQEAIDLLEDRGKVTFAEFEPRTSAAERRRSC